LGARLAQHDVHLVTVERLRAADQDRQQSRRGVTRLPELARQFLLRPQPVGERAQPAEVHSVIVTVSLDLPEGKAREAVADQIGPPLLILQAVLEQLGADLDHNIEVAHIQRRLLSEPDLDGRSTASNS
jgi:hypothetical protein